MEEPPTYSISRWDECYENNRTRKMVQMQWIPVPNSHDGNGYLELVDRKNGAAYLGAWIAILQVASKCPERGKLVKSNGKPHTAESIARVTRLDVKVIGEALQVLAGEDVAWLCQAGGTQRAPSAHPTDEEGKGMEGKEGNGIEVNGTPDGGCMPFDEFWEVYPKKVGKAHALKAWDKTKSQRPDAFTIIGKVRELAKSEQWTRDGGQYIPHPATWLNRGGWDDEVTNTGRAKTDHKHTSQCDDPSKY